MTRIHAYLLGASLCAAPLVYAEFDKEVLNESLFTTIYRTNIWGDLESKSGPGSSTVQTVVIRNELPRLLRKLEAKILLDAPCGDFNWMNKTDLSMLDMYVGMDIVVDAIRDNIEKYANEKRVFLHGDIAKSPIPQADAVLCRDCLTHLSYEDIFAALRNFKKAGIKYLITSTYPNRATNIDFNRGSLLSMLRYRPLNFELAPFNFPKPLYIINENNTEQNGGIADKSLGVWRLEDLPL